MSFAYTATTDFFTVGDYIASCVGLARERLERFSSIKEIAAAEREINRYPRLESLETPRRVLVLEDGAAADRLAAAQGAILRGEVLFETMKFLLGITTGVVAAGNAVSTLNCS